MTDHLIIPDVQAKEGVPMEHLDWIGQYILDHKPEVIICIGDFADMPSLSSYDKGKKSFEGRRYKKDINAAREAMDRLERSVKIYNKKKIRDKHKQYLPHKHMTLGNHEYRIVRAVECQPELDGVIGYHDLPYEGWIVHDFLKPVFVDGVCYTHYMANPMTGNPYSGLASTILKTVGHSFVVGHAQKLDIATRCLVTGEQQWAIVAGSSYLHNEDYKGYQGNHHWRGIIHLRNVNNGNFDPEFISLKSLELKYGSDV